MGLFCIASKFNRSFKRYGGLLARREIEKHYGQYRDNFDFVRMLADAIIEENSSPRWGIVHFNYINSKTLNAVARMYGHRKYFIGLSCGCVPLFQESFTNILRSSTVLAEVIDGSPSSCTFVNRLLDDFKRISPTFLMYMALCIYVYHELSHIIRGHIDFRRKTTGQVELAEYRSGSKRYIKSIVSQALEIDADFVGAMNSLHLASRMIRAGNHKDHHSLRFFNSTEGIGYIWSFVVGILFGLIDMHDRLSHGDVAPTHPNPRTRGEILLYKMSTLCNAKSDGDLEKGPNHLMGCMEAGQEHAFEIMSKIGAFSAPSDVQREMSTWTALSILENELDPLFSEAGAGECGLRRGEGRRFLDPLG